jgi:hypothetical protein
MGIDFIQFKKLLRDLVVIPKLLSENEKPVVVKGFKEICKRNENLLLVKYSAILEPEDINRLLWLCLRDSLTHGSVDAPVAFEAVKTRFI